MKTCLAVKCPFIWYCKNYSLDEDHANGCETQAKIMEAAGNLAKRNKTEAKMLRERKDEDAQTLD